MMVIVYLAMTCLGFVMLGGFACCGYRIKMYFKNRKVNKTEIAKMRLQAIHINPNNQDLKDMNKEDIYKEF